MAQKRVIWHERRSRPFDDGSPHRTDGICVYRWHDETSDGRKGETHLQKTAVSPKMRRRQDRWREKRDCPSTLSTVRMNGSNGHTAFCRRPPRVLTRNREPIKNSAPARRVHSSYHVACFAQYHCSASRSIRLTSASFPSQYASISSGNRRASAALHAPYSSRTSAWIRK